MPGDRADEKNGHPSSSASRIVVEAATIDPMPDEAMREAREHEASRQSRGWDDTVSTLAAITDETDTDEVWSAVLRNLGVEAAGGGD